MTLQEHVYSVLVVSAAESFNNAISALMPESHYSPVRYVGSINAAKRMLSDQAYDFVIINAPLPDDIGTNFAIDAGTSSGTVALLIVRADILEGVRDKVTEHGVFTLSKPTTTQMFAVALDWLASARERLRRVEKKSLSMEEKMEEIRLVNRAKWLLITELKMDEPQAHRFIEKQAMDRCISRRSVAEEIIRMYA